MPYWQAASAHRARGRARWRAACPCARASGQSSEGRTCWAETGRKGGRTCAGARYNQRSLHRKYIIAYVTAFTNFDGDHLAYGLDCIEPRILVGLRLKRRRSDEVAIVRF